MTAANDNQPKTPKKIIGRSAIRTAPSGKPY